MTHAPVPLTAIPSVAPIVLAGPVARLTDDSRTSAIAKRAIDGPWTITPAGLVGDAQADLDNHGGPDKALNHYPRDHYAYWRRVLGDHPLLAAPGAFGENLSTEGWTEDTVHIGDVVLFGQAVLQVSHGRQPCRKLNARFARKAMALDVQTTGFTGWYCRVLEPGTVESGATMRIVERPRPDWSMSRLIGVLYKRVDDTASLEAMAEMPELAEDWRLIARKRLASRRTEDWTSRLGG